jgi:hypothetical protein
MLLALPAAGQHVHPASPSPPADATAEQHVHAPASTPDSGDIAAFLMRQTSGTSLNPAAAPMHMEMTQRDQWMLMLHGMAFLNHVEQSGPRGADKTFSTNWLMAMADRRVKDDSHLMLRAMLSLEPATISDQMYPELFQTGETANGRAIRDGQHPHDFFMELAAEYARPITAGMIGYVYGGPMADPSLGPVAYPHRASASELPQATLSHHVQDSTHIATNVVTLGVQRGPLGFAISGFHGEEPDEDRWDLDLSGAIDSWSARLTFDPSPNWSGQISTGHLEDPEALHPGDVQRSTASISFSRPLSRGHVDATAIYGRNDVEVEADEHGSDTESFLLEGVWRFLDRNYATARAEIVDKNELFSDEDVPHEIEHGSFRVKAITLGYTRDVFDTGTIVGGAGGNVTLYDVPNGIQPYYGSQPRSYYVYFRLRNSG